MDRDGLWSLVRERARHHCEYCWMPQWCYSTVLFPIDHIIARQHGGETRLGNLALSCLHCNAHKGPNIAGIDPRTGLLTPLYNPRTDRWSRHFRWRNARLTARSDVGRVTIIVLAMNDPALIAVRKALIAEAVFPPRFRRR